MARSPVNAERPSRFLLRAWRWHFYAGLLCLPLLTMLALTGIVVLFENDIDEIVYADALFAAPTIGAEQSTGTHTFEAQKIAAQSEFPEWTLKKLRPAPADDRTSAFTFSDSSGEEQTVFVNPYTTKVQGVRQEAWTPGNIATRIHGELMAGSVGDFIVELAASWGLVLVASGLYLWWPRKPLAPKTWAPRTRAFWSDLHASTGIWLGALLTFFLLTGLCWSGVWGDKVAKVWTRFPAQLWDDVPKSGLVAGSLNSIDDKAVPWAVEASTLPTSKEAKRAPTAHDGHARHAGQGTKGTEAETGAIENFKETTLPAPTLDDLVSLARSYGLREGLTIALPSKPDSVFTIAAMPADPRGERTLHIDRYSGALLADIRWSDYGTAAKAVEGGIALHEGRFFGFWNKMLALLGCLLVLLSCVSAAVLCWRRRPTLRNLRAPSRVVLPTAWKGALIIIAVLGIAFPLVGVSLVVVALVDSLITSRVPFLRRAFQ